MMKKRLSRENIISLRIINLKDQSVLKNIENFTTIEKLYPNKCNLTSLPSEFNMILSLADTTRH